LFALKGYNAKQLIREFTSKGWIVGSICKLSQKLPVTGLVDRRPSSVISACTTDHIDLVYEWVLAYTKMARLQIIFAHCT